MHSRRTGDPVVERTRADRGGRAVRAVQPSDPMQVDVGLLRDTAALLTARRELDELLVQLTAAPFSSAAYDGLRAYLAGSGRRAQAAYARVCASTVRPGC